MLCRAVLVLLPVCTQAAVVADKNAKLSIFATRPAIYSPMFNFITETLGTVALILLALLIELQVGGTRGCFLALGLCVYKPCPACVKQVHQTAMAPSPDQPHLSHPLGCWIP